ncbi:MAG: hydroxymethylglutaryl-CoA lyase [Acidimicrobiaceae bacterium]|nr:hydroxymethylglutaryl-CoA lyase [Acidimicrobiaceae bacterium]
MDAIEIVEVSARDGLQNESTSFSTEEKIRLIEGCVKGGVDRIEVASFVNPKRVPQMADGDSVIAGLSQSTLSRSIGLVLNERGMQRAIEAGIPEINFVVVATDTFADRNQSSTTEGLLQTWKSVARMAKESRIRASVGISAAFGCPYEGEVSQDRVLWVLERIMESQPDEVGLADTIGSGVPKQVESMIRSAKRIMGSTKLRCHFHNTRNVGLANAYVAAAEGATALDSSLGGIGGCPFAPKATGNIPTEDLVWMLQRSGFKVNADLSELMTTSSWLESQLGRALPSMVYRAGIFPPVS